MTALWNRPDVRRISAFGIDMRLVDVQDLPLLCRWRNDPEIRPFMDDRREVSPQVMSVWLNKQRAGGTSLAYLCSAGEKPIGYTELKKIDEEAGSCEGGVFLFGKEHMGTGLGAAIALCREVSMRALGLTTLISRVRKGNTRGIRFCQKYGGRYAGEDSDFLLYIHENAPRLAGLEELARHIGREADYARFLGGMPPWPLLRPAEKPAGNDLGVRRTPGSPRRTHASGAPLMRGHTRMADELHLSLHAPLAASAAEAVTSLRAQLAGALREHGLDEADVALLRFFCSDVYNQAPVIAALWPETAPCQRIFIGQRPLDSAYISLQAYALAGAEKADAGPGSLEVRHGGYTSLWLLEYPAVPGNSEEQTDVILERLKGRLAARGMTLAGNVLRTWYYLRDIDNTYAGMIKSRVRHYEAAGLTPETHFIASTGIEGRSPDPHALVALHAHAVAGLAEGQVRYLRALCHLSPTSLYGVNFERATLVTYGDRKQCHISGTASIDAEGNVLHKGDVARQLGRTLENMEALLAEGGMRIADLAAATVYLRDGADAPRIAGPLAEALPAGCAVNINHGAVCRPDWLVEIEAEAVSPHTAPLAPFI